MNLSFYIEFYKEKEHSYCRDSECFTVYCGIGVFLTNVYYIEKDDVTDDEIKAYVQQVMDDNGWEMLVSIERIEESSRVVMQAPDEIVTCPCGKSFPLSESHGHWFGENYCSAKCWDNHPPEPECIMPPHLRE